MKHVAICLTAVLAITFMTACDSMKKDKHDDKAMDGMAMKDGMSMTAVANIAPSVAASTQPSMGKTMGTITFTQKGNNVTVVAELTGLPPGKHGIHIHEKGDVSAPDLMSAGGHFNPDKHIHGGPTTSPVHAGDLGNIEAGADGTAKMKLKVDDISIGGKNDITGKSVIIHAKADDFKTQPSGDSGARIAGGVIEKK